MEKSNDCEKGINYVLDTRRITEKTQHFILNASESECRELAQWYEIPALLSLQVHIDARKKEDVIIIEGKITADMCRECVITGNEFNQKMNADFKVLFSTTHPSKQPSEIIIDIDEEPVEYLPRPQIFFKEVVTEQFGLNLDAFPKSTNEIFEYRESDVHTEKENPFSVLKGLTKV